MTGAPIERREHQISYPIVGEIDDWAHASVNAGGLWWWGDTRHNPVAGPYGIGPQSHAELLAEGPPVRTPHEVVDQLEAWCREFVAAATSPPVLLWTEPIISACLADVSALERWDVRGQTALHVAAALGSDNLVASVLASGAAVDRPSRTGAFTPLHTAASRVHGNIVKRLVDAGADPHAQDAGKNCLNLATESLVGGAGLSALVDHLLRLGLDPNGGGARPTPLANARARQREDIAKVLLEAGASASGNPGMRWAPFAGTDPADVSSRTSAILASLAHDGPDRLAMLDELVALLAPAGARRRARIDGCETCRDIPPYGRSLGTAADPANLPAPCYRVIPAGLLSRDRCREVVRCDMCGTCYYYVRGYEYLAGGSEDEETFTQLWLPGLIADVRRALSREPPDCGDRDEALAMLARALDGEDTPVRFDGGGTP